MERNTEEKITVLIASVKEREQQLRIVLNRLVDQYDLLEIHLVLNYYDEVPSWLDDKPKIVCHLNPQNKNAHDAIWSYVPDDGYVFCVDDDLLYPSDFFYKLIAAIERHERRAVVTAHGSNLQLPAGDYMDSRVTYGFSDRRERDIFNDICGVGCCAFHASTLQPTLQDFQISFCRDIYFSLLCAKNNVSIVNAQRPSNWINPLVTPGSTVYEETLGNKHLRDLKNRVLKEQLLPALHCKNNVGPTAGSGSYVLITDYGFDKRLMDKTLETLDEVSDGQTNIIVFSDELKDYSFQPQGVEAIYDYTKRPVLMQYVTPDERAIGIMASKVLCQYRFVLGLSNGSKVISADGDLLFLRDAFQAFDKELVGCDIGVTTRCEQYKYPVNGGMIFFRVNDQVKDFLRFLIGQIYERTWPELIAYEKQFGHDKQENPNNWYFDQNLWNVAFLNAHKVEWRFNVIMGDATCKYNYAPHSDGTPEQIASGKAKLMQAYHDESVHVLHLKSRLKELLFEGLLP